MIPAGVILTMKRILIKLKYLVIINFAYICLIVITYSGVYAQGNAITLA